jgi:acyl-CoA thioesterase FadM
MMICILCHFATERDDVALTLAASGTICLRCFDRETESQRPMPKALRRQLEATLALVDAT